MNKLFILSISLAVVCLIPGSNAQLPWANLNEFLAAIRNFNLFQIPPLNVADPSFQQYAIITSLFNNRRGCPGGRVFTECFTCDIPCSQRDGIGCDDLPCRRGCGCAQGYFVNNAGFCVPEERCGLVEPNPTTDGGDGICPGGRVYSMCARCDLLCSERINPPACSDRCRPGCSCPNNYYLNADGNCVTGDRCEGPRTTRPEPTISRPACRGNRVYVDCASCDVPCSQRNNPPPCTLQCRRGCACPRDYFINRAGVCVRRSRCQRPPTTRYVPPTTRYVPPTTRYVPPTTRYVPPTTRYVPPTTRYVPPTTRYVPPSPTGIPGSGRCPQNQVYADCITCIYTCGERFTFTPDQCRAPCRQGCHCNRGEYLNEDTNRCVRPDQCPGAVPTRPRPTRPRPTRPRPTRPRPTQTFPTRPEEPRCYGNQIYDRQCVRCERTCETLAFDPRACTEPCRQGCRCPDGLVLYGDDCIRAERCPGFGRPSPTQRPFPTRRPGPGQCSGGQIYDTFCVRCVVTCENRLTDRRGCREPCRVGCRCPDGLLLLQRGDTEECVYVNDCPQVGLGGGPPNECGECVNGRCTPDITGQLYCLCDQGYTGVNCDEDPIFLDRRCGGRCPPNQCIFRGAQFGYVCNV